MSEDTTTTTEEEAVQADESQQLENSETQAVQADESADTTTQTNETETEADATDDESELMEWAEKKGIKTDNTAALLKMVREGEQKMHAATTQAHALKESISTVGEDAGYDETSQLLSRLKVNEFYLDNPDAKQLDDAMANIIKAKPYLAEDLDTVYELAKSRSQAINDVSERQAGRKEALAQAAKAERAGAPKVSATTRESVSEVTDADIAKMTVAEYKAYKADTGFNPFKQS